MDDETEIQARSCPQLQPILLTLVALLTLLSLLNRPTTTIVTLFNEKKVNKSCLFIIENLFSSFDNMFHAPLQAQLKRSNVLTSKDYKLWDFKVPSIPSSIPPPPLPSPPYPPPLPSPQLPPFPTVHNPWHT